jgi:hypothetical protein
VAEGDRRFRPGEEDPRRVADQVVEGAGRLQVGAPQVEGGGEAVERVERPEATVEARPVRWRVGVEAGQVGDSTVESLRPAEPWRPR